MEVDLLGDAGRQLTSFVGVERQTQLEEDVLQAHQAEADGAPLRVRVVGFVGRVEVDVDDAVEERHGQADDVGQALVVEGLVALRVRVHHCAQVDRAEVAHRGLGLVGDLEDLGTEVGQVHHVRRAVDRVHAGLVALGVGRVLEGHPAVAGLGQAAHHAAVELAGRDLCLVQALVLGLHVRLAEVVAVEIDQVRDLLRVEEAPLPVLFDTLHEQVGHPVGQVQVVRAPSGVADVLLQLEERLDVGVPRLEVHTCGTLATPALVDRGDRGVERLEPRHDAVGQAVGAADERAA